MKQLRLAFSSFLWGWGVAGEVPLGKRTLLTEAAQRDSNCTLSWGQSKLLHSGKTVCAPHFLSDVSPVLSFQLVPVLVFMTKAFRRLFKGGRRVLSTLRPPVAYWAQHFTSETQAACDGNFALPVCLAWSFPSTSGWLSIGRTMLPQQSSRVIVVEH